jgi:hypothetical protein
MVHATRFSLLMLLSNNPKHQRLLNIVFHHHSMTSGPLISILRSIIAEIVTDPDYGVIAPERDAVLAIIKYIATEYEKLASIRNNLLHGTWHIGWAHPDDQDFSELRIHKFKSTSRGFESQELPKSADELNSITKECDEIEHLIRSLWGCLIMPNGTLDGGCLVTKKFQKNEKNGRQQYKESNDFLAKISVYLKT